MLRRLCYKLPLPLSLCLPYGLCLAALLFPQLADMHSSVPKILPSLHLHTVLGVETFPASILCRGVFPSIAQTSMFCPGPLPQIPLDFLSKILSFLPSSTLPTSYLPSSLGDLRFLMITARIFLDIRLPSESCCPTSPVMPSLTALHTA